MNRIDYLIVFLLCISCNDSDVKTIDIDLPSEEATLDTIKAEENNLTWFADPLKSTNYKNGDIVLIHSKSDLSSPISLATESDYTHCAIFWEMTNGPKFFEACSGVEDTQFEKFIKDKKGTLLLVLRLRERDSLFKAENEERLFFQMRDWLGLDYDGQFLWNDDEMYCSELVYKLYKSAGIKLCNLKKLEDFDLNSPEVKKELEKRYNGKIPMKEPVIAPVDLIYSNLLDTVYYSK